MQTTITQLRVAANAARHLASQLKQLTLRSLAGYQPSVQQIDHLQAISDQLDTTLAQLATGAGTRMAQELRSLVKHEPAQGK